MGPQGYLYHRGRQGRLSAARRWKVRPPSQHERLDESDQLTFTTQDRSRDGRVTCPWPRVDATAPSARTPLLASPTRERPSLHRQIGHCPPVPCHRSRQGPLLQGLHRSRELGRSPHCPLPACRRQPHPKYTGQIAQFLTMSPTTLHLSSWGSPRSEESGSLGLRLHRRLVRTGPIERESGKQT